MAFANRSSSGLRNLLAAVIMALSAAVCAGATQTTIDVEPVWSAHYVGFTLVTHGDRQFVAYYDAKRQMTVASRKLSETKWTFKKLPRFTGWDSHNYVTMAVDSAGHLHVSGDMHVDPLVYFRTTKPLDVNSLTPVHKMTGDREDQVTYPTFLKGPADQFIFRYRDGSSGNGDDIYNVYDVARRSWRHLTSKPVISGQGLMNAYASGPTLGPDGWYHMIYVWRDTPDAATNHDLSYTRSKDWINWQTAAGKPQKLSITLATSDVVDPVKPKGGLINGGAALGFDSKARPVISYHKYDSAGNTQIHVARFEAGKWKRLPVTTWKYRWNFGGTGTLNGEVSVGPPRVAPGGKLTIAYSYPLGKGTITLDEATLKPIPATLTQQALAALSSSASSAVAAVTKAVAATAPVVRTMQTHTQSDRGTPPPKTSFQLTWRTWGRNNDRPVPPPWPAPTMLQVIKTVQ
jgi:hypothetical protein